MKTQHEHAQCRPALVAALIVTLLFAGMAHGKSTVSGRWEVDYIQPGVLLDDTVVVTGTSAAEATQKCLDGLPKAQDETDDEDGDEKHICSAPRFVATVTFSANPQPVPVDTDSDGVPDSTDQCPTVPASTPDGCPATPPPTTEVWTQCAVERGSCTWTGGTTRQICYAVNAAACSDTNTANDRKLTRASPVSCNNATFTDPAVNVVKACFWTSSPPPPPPTGTGTATLRWTPPTQNTDGSTLINLAGYWIVYGTSATALTKSVQVSSPGATSHVITDLAPATWYFAIKAYTSAGTESANSTTASKVIAP